MTHELSSCSFRWQWLLPPTSCLPALLHWQQRSSQATLRDKARFRSTWSTLGIRCTNSPVTQVEPPQRAQVPRIRLLPLQTLLRHQRPPCLTMMPPATIWHHRSTIPLQQPLLCLYLRSCRCSLVTLPKTPLQI